MSSKREERFNKLIVILIAAMFVLTAFAFAVTYFTAN